MSKFLGFRPAKQDPSSMVIAGEVESENQLNGEIE